MIIVLLILLGIACVAAGFWLLDMFDSLILSSIVTGFGGGLIGSAIIRAFQAVFS